MELQENMVMSKNDAISIVKGVLVGACLAYPSVGNYILTLMSEISSCRIEDFIDQLCKRIKNLEESKIDFDYLKSDEYHDILIHGMRVRTENRSKIKAELLYQILIESIAIERNTSFSADEKVRFLDILNKLIDIEIKFLDDFIKGSFQEKTREQIYQMGNYQALGLDGLINHGLLRIKNTVNTRTHTLSSNVMQTQAILKECIVQTALFKRFITYLTYLKEKA